MVSSTAAAAHRWYATSESAETQLLLLPSHSGLVNVSVLSQGILVSLRYNKFSNHQLAATFDDIQYGHRNSLQLVSSTISTVYQLRSTSLCFCCHSISRQDISSKSYNNSFIYDSAIEIDTDLVCRVWFLASTDVGDPRCRTVIVSTVAAPWLRPCFGWPRRSGLYDTSRTEKNTTVTSAEVKRDINLDARLQYITESLHTVSVDCHRPLAVSALFWMTSPLSLLCAVN